MIKTKILLSSFFLFVLMILIALYVPTSLPTHSDFSALYNTDLALVHRVPIYDLERVEALALQYKVLQDQVNPHFLFNSLNWHFQTLQLAEVSLILFTPTMPKLSKSPRNLLSFKMQLQND